MSRRKPIGEVPREIRAEIAELRLKYAGDGISADEYNEQYNSILDKMYRNRN